MDADTFVVVVITLQDWCVSLMISIMTWLDDF